jgi:levoglucosan dehydrogenase
VAEDLRFALVGGGFMGKAYSLALADLPIYCSPLPLRPVRELVVEANDELAADAQQRLGFNRASSDWRSAVEDPGIEVVAVLLPNHMHHDVVMAAVAAGKHVICEKPLDPSLDQAREMARAAASAGVVHQTGFNWRLTPAGLMGKKLIDDGTIGEIRSFRGHWLADFGGPELPMTWRFQRETAGSGALGDIGTHVIDWARFLVGEITEVISLNRTYIKQRALPDGSLGDVDVDDDASVLVEFDTGAHGLMHFTWIAPGHKSDAGFEIYGSEGSLSFDWEHMNELRLYDSRDPADRQGFRTILVGPQQPHGEHFWPLAGYQIGYAETKVIQLLEMVRAVAGEGPVSATFDDGVAATEVEHAIQRSWETRGWVEVERSRAGVSAASDEATR